MWGLLDWVYFKFHRNAIQTAKIRLKKISIETVLQCISKNCWRFGIQYEVLIKTSDTLVIKIRGKKQCILLRYHKADMVFYDDFCRFLNFLVAENIPKGVYITTGVFEERILKVKSNPLFRKQIMLEDYRQFIIGQLLFTGQNSDRFKQKKLKFFKYLPT